MGKAQNQSGLLETMEENQNKVPNAESTRACLKNKNCTKRMFHFPFS
jgi:hypothetical protein